MQTAARLRRRGNQTDLAGRPNLRKALNKIACFFVLAKELATKKQAKYFLEPESRPKMEWV
jgi:hypothetical protein